MFDAQLVICNSSSYEIQGPWMTRGGDDVVVALDYVAASTVIPKITVKIKTKARDEAGDGGTPISISLEATTLGPHPAKLEGSMKDLVRFVYTVEKNPSGGNAGDWALLRMLQPSWYDSVE